MPTIDVVNINGEKVSQAELADSLFGVPVNPHVLHEVVTLQLSRRRSGTASVKNRSDITGSGRKLFRQKGTGRARRGDIKSPLLRGGGVVFGPKPKTYDYKVPKRVMRLALKMALSSKVGEKNLLVLDRLELDNIKTKKFLETIRPLNLSHALIVVSGKNGNLELSARNLPNITVLRSEGLNVYDILSHKQLVLLESTIKDIEGRLLK